ncbi:MAG: hypothetical protein GY852_04875, partial [bacterium]|nr:hypothetical protein [bacterium]
MKAKLFPATIIFVQILLAFSAKANSTFSRTYSGSETRGCEAIPALNGYYLSCIDFQSAYFGVLWLLRTDSLGEVIWSRPFYESITQLRDFESGGFIHATPDGGCIIVGYSEPRATGVNTDVCLVKVDSTGTLNWEKIYGLNDDNVYSITGIAGSNNGILLAFSHCYSDAFFVMFDFEGNTLWQSEPLEEDYYIEALSTDNSDGFIAIGKTGYGQECWILKIDEAGSTELIPLPESTQSGFISSITSVETGGYAFCGRTENSDTFLTRIDEQGNQLWSYTSDFEGTDRATCVQATEHGMLSLTGMEQLSNEYYGWLALFSNTGELQWKRDYSLSRFTIIESVRQTNDGGYILCGMANQHETGGAWLIKTDEQGHVAGWEEGLPAITENTIAIKEPLGWIISCEVVSDSISALNRASDLQEQTDIQTGVLWIPDWASLSGYAGWLVYAGPYHQVEDPALEQAAGKLFQQYPEAFCLFVGSELERSTFPQI